MRNKLVGGNSSKAEKADAERKIHPRAGMKADPEVLMTREEVAEKYNNNIGELKPVKNGTSGHRGKLGIGFTDAHIASMTQALIDIREEQGTYGPTHPEALHNTELGPILMGKDVRYASDLAHDTAAEVFAGNGMTVLIQPGERSTPTPVISHSIINRVNQGIKTEGVIVTASHNPPEDGGFKSNGLNGGPNTATKPIDAKANEIMGKPSSIKRMPYAEGVKKGLIVEEDTITPYVEDLVNLVDMDIIKQQPFAVAPLGGSASGIYEMINEKYGTQIRVVDPQPDPTRANSTHDWDGKLRGDPSSPYVMKAVEGKREELNVPLIMANDNDADRFGGEDSTGILNPNHVLCVLFDYLCSNRNFDVAMKMGRTIGTTHMLNKIAENYGRGVNEVNVGFKWYVEGLENGEYVLAGEESAGATFPRFDGSLWTTEKDGIGINLLMMEIVAKTGKDIGTLYKELEGKYGTYHYERIDAPATAEKKARLEYLAENPAEVEKLLEGKIIAGRKIDHLVIGDGVKVVLEGDIWNLKRPSGTEDIIKDYREERGDNLDTVRQASEEIGRLLGV